MKFLIFILICLPLFSQENKSRFFWENDVFFPPSDHYYTNGFRFEYWKEKSFNKENLPKELGISFGQNLFTPTEIKRNIPKFKDRPYSAWIYLGFVNSFYSKNYSLFWEISLGSLGENALGKEIQTQIHQVIKSEIPEGWTNLISNKVTLQNNLDYKYFYNKYFGLHSSLKLGNYNSSLGIGTIFRFGKINSLYMPGFNIFESSNPPLFYNEKEKFFYISFLAWHQFYDGTLQNNSSFKFDKTIDLQILLDQNLYLTQKTLNIDWNNYHTLTSRFWLFYGLYSHILPENLSLNVILFNTLFNGNSKLDNDEKKLILFLARDQDLYNFSNLEKKIYFLSFYSSNSLTSQILYYLSLLYLAETTLQDKSLNHLDLIFLTYLNNRISSFSTKPKSFQGKLNFGYVTYLNESLFFQCGVNISTTDFYQPSYLPSWHKWMSFQFVYFF